MIDLTEEQIQRYSRHILLQDVGVEGQEKLLKGKVLIVGAGGLGAPVAMYLAAAGVGTIGIVDADVVDLSNLQRQIIHFTADVDKPKVLSAKEKMEAINPDVKVVTYQEFLSANNALDIINNYDFVVDGTDNFPVKFLINDACVMAGKPFSMMLPESSESTVFSMKGMISACSPRKAWPSSISPAISVVKRTQRVQLMQRVMSVDTSAPRFLLNPTRFSSW